MSLESNAIAAVTPARATKPAGASRLYLAAWMVAGVAAAGYLVVAGTRPELLANLSAGAARPAASSAASVAGTTGDELALRDTVSRLQSEVTRLTANVIASEERASILAEKLAVLQSPAAKVAAADPAAKPASQSPPATAAALAGKFVEPAAPQAADASASAPLKVINQAAAPQAAAQATAAAAPIETGSIAPAAGKAAVAPSAKAPISFGAPVVTPAPRTLGVQIANGQSVDALRLSWTMLTEQNDSLRPLQPRYTSKGGADGESFDLVAGPIKNAAQANRVCRSLQARGIACQVTDFEGNAL